MAGDGPILGIDLGTTNSVAAILEGAEPRVIPNSEGSTKTPSVVAFFEGDKAVVGEIARRQAATNPERTVSSVKRLMGRYYSDLVESGDVERFRLQSDESDRALIGVDGVVYTPQQISALILGKLKESAEEYTNHPITQAVITVPAYFDDLQRTATLEAGRIAGLDVLRLVNEPTAAAMAYGLGRDTEELVAVYDLGGGTFDFSILDIDHKTFEVISCSGDTHLGGDDIDERVLQELKSRFEREHGFALEADAVMLRRLRDTSEKAKCELSTLTETHVSLPFFAYQNGAPLHLDCILTREELETLMEPIVRRTLEICGRALRDAGLKKKDLNKVILVGGSTRTPLVQDLVEDFFGIAPFKGVNPDEIVALGAATQGGALTGALQEVVLLDVTPHSLGVEVKDGRTSVIVKKNATVPIKETKTFTTTEDDQPFVNIHILQGESDVASDNRSLGKFRLADVPKAPAGSPRIRVTFYITADGVLEVSAGDLQSGKEQSLTISHSFLTEEERRQRERRRPPKAQRAKAKAAATAPPAAVARETPIPSTPSIEAVSPAPLPNGDSQDFDLVTSDG
ncbi:MAG: molecular chaperone DnaK, partial [Candidatus Sumerlaeota bacterium]|nr:molecular chaperone DnaK [Candidatus Sumerlaeota bacterium]